jgi:hypothetical protein
MRKGLAAMALCLCLGWAAPAGAQQPATSFWTGADPRHINFTPVDTSQFYKKYNLTQVVRTPTQQKAFDLSNIFPKITMPSWPPKIGSSQYPPPGTKPFRRPLLPIQQ